MGELRCYDTKGWEINTATWAKRVLDRTFPDVAMLMVAADHNRLIEAEQDAYKIRLLLRSRLETTLEKHRSIEQLAASIPLSILPPT